MEDPVYDRLCKERDGVLFKARVQARYHRRRQRFFDIVDKTTTSVTIALGVSIFGQFFKDAVVAALISLLGFLALIFGYSDQKHVHKDLAERFSELASSIVAVPFEKLSVEHAAMWAAEFERLCALCPPSLKTLTLICEREQATADGHPNHVPEQLWLWRQLRHII